MDGTFSVSLSTPFGRRDGTVRLVSGTDGSLSGWLEALGRRSPFAGGRTDGSRFEFSGRLQAPFGAIPYRASGTVVEDTLRADAATPFGNFHITGRRAG